MQYQVVSDKQGPWAIVFTRDPWHNGHLSNEEQAEIQATLAKHNLALDSQFPPAVSYRWIRIRVKPQQA